MQASNGISVDTEHGLRQLLEQGAQVPLLRSVSPLPFSAWGVSEAAQDRSAAALFEHLQMGGLAQAYSGGEALLAIKKVFKLAGEQDAKKTTAVASYSQFVEFMRKTKVLTRNSFERDPDSFWQLLWHSQSVQHLYCNYGWDTASSYHTSVM